MAKRTFLNNEELLAAQKHLGAVDLSYGKNALAIVKARTSFSSWLDERLLEKLTSLPGWESAQPIALGSWARGELTPNSDVDLLLVGEEAAVKELVDAAQTLGVVLRYRVPEVEDDWTLGVKPFDVLAILQGRSFSVAAEQKLSHQQQLIQKKGQPFVRALLKAMVEERLARAERYDSISNFLEPNIKYGPGGLRDLQQALYIFELFQNKFVEKPNAIQVLEKNKQRLLLLRQKMNLLFDLDVILASEQKGLGEWFGFSEIKAFMKQVQVVLSEVSFCADWVVETAKSSS